jgi:uncharacterized protein RhaS with RHS repeats
MTKENREFGLPSGEWVSGTTLNDERIRGFVRQYDPLTSLYTVTVVESDRKESVGRTVFAREAQVAALPLDVEKDRDALRDMIDLSLAMRDEAWFYELSGALLALNASKQHTHTAPG